MKISEIKEATTQMLIERLILLIGNMSAKNGYGIKGLLKESNNIAKELDSRGIVEFDSFIKNIDCDIE